MSVASKIRLGATAGGSRSRDLFPLPIGCPNLLNKTVKLSRKVQRRIQRAAHKTVSVSTVAGGLNFLAGCKSGPDFAPGSPSESQAQFCARTRISKAVSDFGFDPLGLDPSGALTQLRGCVSYFEDASC